MVQQAQQVAAWEAFRPGQCWNCNADPSPAIARAPTASVSPADLGQPLPNLCANACPTTKTFPLDTGGLGRNVRSAYHHTLNVLTSNCFDAIAKGTAFVLVTTAAAGTGADAGLI